MDWYKSFVKPTLDFFVAAVGILVLWPLMLLLYGVNRLTFSSGWFLQTRIGRHLQPFTLFKMRTLAIEGDDHSAPAWGRFLRSTSLDELPQLINILRGEMSLVGPRPLLPEYVAHYSEEQQKRHLVKPGITGLAQVSGRNSLSWNDSLALDVAYAENVSLTLDLKILLRTIPQVLKFKETKHLGKPNRGAFHHTKSE